MELFWEIVSFAVKALVVVAAVGLIVNILWSAGRRGRGPRGLGHLEVLSLNERYQDVSDALRGAVLERKAFRELLKAREREEKRLAKAQPEPETPRVFVLDFHGDLFASAVRSLREEVSALVSVARPIDEVVVRLESPGGAVPHYGLAAAQLARLKDKQVKVTVCIDRIAASGGYLMACIADSVVAAPFAIVGSIGVVAQVPNVHRLLKRFDIDYEEATAGEFKRTVSFFGEVTEKGRAKLQEQLEETHHLFKSFVRQMRPRMDIDRVATGEYWLGSRALELGLVDQLGTSDDYLLARSAEAQLYRLHFKPERTLRDRLGGAVADALERVALRWAERVRALQLR